MGARASTSEKGFAASFPAAEGSRGPTLEGFLIPVLEDGWRLVLTAPLGIQLFDAFTAVAIPHENAEAEQIMNEHLPLTSCTTSECSFAAARSESEGQLVLMAVGCQDGTAIVYELRGGAVHGPLHVFSPPVDEGGTKRPETTTANAVASSGSGRNLAQSITVLRIHQWETLFVGSSGRCVCWDLKSGQLLRLIDLPDGPDGPATPTALCPVPSSDETGVCLWVGLDFGNIAVFNVTSGILARCFSCAGPEVLVALAYFQDERVVFALSAHRRVSVWDAQCHECIQKYPAELMTCGADLSSMTAFRIQELDLSLLILAGVDGSICVRRVSRRAGGKLNCVLVSFFECVSADGAPITSLTYHIPSDSMVVGDAGCAVSVLSKLKDQLGNTVQAHNELQESRAAARDAASGDVNEHPVGSNDAHRKPAGTPSSAVVLGRSPPAQPSPPVLKQTHDETVEDVPSFSEDDLPAEAPVFSGA